MTCPICSTDHGREVPDACEVEIGRQGREIVDLLDTSVVAGLVKAEIIGATRSAKWSDLARVLVESVAW